VVQFLLDRGRARIEVRTRIREDISLSERVRQRALALAGLEP
jgi:hypothetical protein